VRKLLLFCSAENLNHTEKVLLSQVKHRLLFWSLNTGIFEEK